MAHQKYIWLLKQLDLSFEKHYLKMGAVLGQEITFNDTEVHSSSIHFHLPSSIPIWVHILLKKLKMKSVVWGLLCSCMNISVLLFLHCTCPFHRNFPCLQQCRQTWHTVWKQLWCSKMATRKTSRNTIYEPDFSLIFWWKRRSIGNKMK